MSHIETQAAYEHNGRLISAEAFYKIACDPRRSVAVEACAGAGKTWMLVSRIVRALLDGVAADGQLRVQPHEILAITFTKRAASEMRERLNTWLAEFAQADHDTLITALRDRGVVIPNDLQPASALAQQLSNLYQGILATGRQVQVRTFHSWFASLLRSAPLAVLQRMDLPANYDLLEDDSQPKALVWRRFYAVLVKDAALKADFESVVYDYGRSQAEKALQTALDKRTEFALADAQGVVDLSVTHFAQQFPEFDGLDLPEDYLSAHPGRQQTLLSAAKALGSASAKTFAAKGVELEMALTAGDLPGVFAALLTATGTPRKFGEKITGIERVREAQDMIERVAQARQQHAAWQYQQRMTRLSRALIKEYGALKVEQGWVDMNDVERAALVMLSDPLLAGWVQEKLDARIKHLLIDEFQDTNPLQWQALRSWLSGYAGASTAPSVFIVGDPKQSIYRFRRAEPQVFRAAKAFVQEGLGGDLLSCDHTRRNATGVIATVNAVMGEASRDDAYEGFRQHTTSATAPGMVCKLPPIARPGRGEGETEETTEWRDSLTTPRELPEETLRTLEARQVAHWIASELAHTGQQPSDVMVLSRKRASLMPLQDELRKRQIAAQIGEKTRLIDCCEVQDVVALLDVLVSPQHDLSLARVLKSPFFDVSDEALVQLALAKQADDISWFDLLQKSELTTKDARGLAPTLLRWKKALDSLPPHDALQTIYTDGDVLARFAVAAPATQRDAVLANLRALLGVALQLGGGRYATPYAFVRALKSGTVMAPATVNAAAVRLLTIHGAKGLEAHTVLLLDTNTPERSADTMGVLIDWPGEAEFPAKLVFLASETQPPACAVATLDAERMERKREELNALYVALTRARHTLAVSSIEPYRDPGRSWWVRLENLAAEVALDSGAQGGMGSRSLDDRSFSLKELPSAPVKYAHAATKTEASGVGEEGDAPDDDSDVARLGKAMHRLLEWGNLTEGAMQAAAREFRLNRMQGEEALAIAQRILQGEGAWAWDPNLLGWQGNEVDLVSNGQAFRLDRLVQRRDAGHVGHWWVLDYKSAHTPQDKPELMAQLQGYRAAVQTIYPDAVVKAAFLTGLGALVEVQSA